MSEMTEILDRLIEMGQDIKDIKTDVAELKTDVAELKTDVAELKTDVAELKTDVAELKTDVAELKTDVSELKTDVSELKTRMENMEITVNQIKGRQDVIFEQTAGLLEFRTETKARLLDIQDSQLATSHILGEHETTIRNLRRRFV